jgi:hypothetical protein
MKPDVQPSSYVIFFPAAVDVNEPPSSGQLFMGEEAEHFSLFARHLPGVRGGPYLRFSREDDGRFALCVVGAAGEVSDSARVDADEFQRLYAIAKMLRL